MLSTGRLRSLLALLLIVLGSAALPCFHSVRAEVPVVQGPNSPSFGQEPDVVRKILGPPSRISRQILSHRALEQWYYGPPHHLRLVFDCPRGLKPRVVQIHKIAPVAP